jgi:hypothetical protein
MSRVMSSLGVVIAILATANVVQAQPPEPRRIVGTRTSGHFEMKGAAQNIVQYATLTFSDDTGAPAFTIDFVAQYQGMRPATI